MIGRLKGRVVRREPGEVLIDVGGVGYELQIPLSTFCQLASIPSDDVVLEVHTHVREGVLQLFGFSSLAEREAFGRLIQVSGVGPKVALAVLSGIEVRDLDGAIRTGDRGRLERIPGIGRKTAERILVDLRDRLDAPRRRRRTDVGAGGESVGTVDGGVRGDAISALTNLGYAPDRASSAVDAAIAAGTDADDRPLEVVLRDALRRLVR